MSAIFPEHELKDERMSERLRLAICLPARVGRRDGTIVDISVTGARVRHTGPLKLGLEIPLSFQTEDGSCSAKARVLSCRIVSLGDGEAGSPLFETRLTFLAVSEESVQRIAKFVRTPQSHAKAN
jgi:hypothetical protein